MGFSVPPLYRCLVHGFSGFGLLWDQPGSDQDYQNGFHPQKDTKIATQFGRWKPEKKRISVFHRGWKEFPVKKKLQGDPGPRDAHLLETSQEDGETIKPLLRLVERRRADIVWELLDVSLLGGVHNTSGSCASESLFTYPLHTLGGGFKYFLFSPWGNDPIWLVFSNGLKPPTSYCWFGILAWCMLNQMCWGLNSHYCHIIGDSHHPQ